MTQLLVHGGTILTQDDAGREVEALLVDGDSVSAVGGLPEVEAAARPDAERLDLEDRVACPGFIDVHNHFVFSVLGELGVDCRTPPFATIEEMLAALEEVAAHTPAGQWVRGWGYNELDLRDGRHPRLEELDRIAPDNPLVLEHASGHICVANSPALAAAGISEASENPRNGVFDRYGRSRRLTGMMHENAAELVDVIAREAIIATDPAAFVDAAHRVARRYASLGLTGICDPCVPENVEAIYSGLLADPAFPIHMVGLGMGRAGKFAPPLDVVDGSRLEGGSGFRIGGVKFFADGGEQCAVCMSKGAAVRGALRMVTNAVRYRSLLALRLLTAPTSRLGGDGMIHSGIKFYDDRELSDLLALTVGHGMTAAVHAMGNEGIDQALDAIEQARRRATDDARFRMEHVMLAGERSLPRLADLGVAAVVQPIFVHDYGFPMVLTGMNQELRVLAFRDLIDAGVLVAGSSDAPVSDPAVLPAIEAAVTRRTKQGEVLDRDQALTVDEALGLYTRNAAQVLGLEARHGSLVPGASADFLVLGDDPRRVPPEDIGQVPVALTYRAGRRVHAATA